MRPSIGQSVHRKEDRRFITGEGAYLDDLAFPGACRAFIVRSPHAHANIRRIEAAAARAAPGVVAVLTGEDVRADGVPPLPCCVRIALKPGTKQQFPDRFILARERARYVGDPVAVIVAETIEQAKDAADLVTVDYDVLPFVSDPARAADPGAPRLHDAVPHNLNFTWEAGDAAATDAAFAGADRIVSIDLINNRVAPTSLETRGAIGAWDDEAGYTLYLSSQGSHWIKDTLCRYVLTDVSEEKVRVVTPDVGGGFGAKLFLTPEYVIVLWAARRLGRTVRWIAERKEGFLSDTHGRDNVTRAEMAVAADGRFLGLRVRTIANMGAYLSEYAPTIPTGDRMHEGAYVVPAVHVEVKGVFTNTGPVESYRGAGRPEATYMIERLVDRAGRETGLGAIEIRRRNFVSAAAIPYASRLGHLYDSGDIPRLLEEALADADWTGLAGRRAEAASRGRLRGLGVSSYIGVCAGEPVVQAQLRFEPGDVVAVVLGTQSSGQGHKTAYSQIVADQLGISMDSVDIRQGDTAWMKAGSVTAGSRSITLGGIAATRAAEAAVAAGKSKAAQLLEADERAIAFQDGRYAVLGANRSVGVFDVANALRGDGVALGGEGEFTPTVGTFTNGCHVCEIEIDPETGSTEIVRYVAVDDFGRIVNPMLVAGQVHGGIAQGIGQALLEGVFYDATGALATPSLNDYALPIAASVPTMSTRCIEIPCLTNPLGTKGAGEAGAIAAPPAVINAIVDALWPFGVRNVDMPATPARVWRAIEAGKHAREATAPTRRVNSGAYAGGAGL
jgi:carbon-monoxide dehydrogenase large subunit